MKQKKIKDILMNEKKDRRFLSHVPDTSGVRKKADRRITEDKENIDDFSKYVASEKAGQRYHVNYVVKVSYTEKNGRHHTVKAQGTDISTTGMLLHFHDDVTASELALAKDISLTFEITPGSMPEGYEMRVKNLPAQYVRHARGQNDALAIGVRFQMSLSQYAAKKRGRYMLAIASSMLFCIVLIVIMMRAESVIYFRFNKYLYLYSIIAATFLLTRYLFGSFYRPVPVDMNFTPSVSIIIPCFNEEEWIQRTILSCMNQDYPPDKLEVMVIDDHSNDHSVEKIQEIIERIVTTDALFNARERLSYYVQPVNKGKREAMAIGAKRARHELLVFVDSDSFLDPFAVRNLVQPFKDVKMGGVSGRTDVANTYTNSLTKMQSVRYYIAFRIMKAAEGFFDAATCLSGPLSCYRKDLVLKYCDSWLHQTFLGQRATFGDDRSMTNFILRHNRTTYQDTAICQTIVPHDYNMFLRQQMRWKRS